MMLYVIEDGKLAGGKDKTSNTNTECVIIIIYVVLLVRISPFLSAIIPFLSQSGVSRKQLENKNKHNGLSVVMFFDRSPSSSS